MSVASVNYEGYKETLKYLNIDCDDNVYDCGDFIKDYYNLVKDFIKESKYVTLNFSSSLDNFFFDGAEYDNAFLKLNEFGVFDLVYIDSDKLSMVEIHDICENNAEFFVPSGSKMTWIELKKYCEI